MLCPKLGARVNASRPAPAASTGRALGGNLEQLRLVRSRQRGGRHVDEACFAQQPRQAFRREQVSPVETVVALLQQPRAEFLERARAGRERRDCAGGVAYGRAEVATRGEQRKPERKQ